MDIIKNMAGEFARSVHYNATNLSNFEMKLQDKLMDMHRGSEKLRFLSYLKDIFETDFQKHMKKCTDPKNCNKNRAWEIGLYSVRQNMEAFQENTSAETMTEVPAMQFFSEGQYFDAFTAIKELVKEARASIILVDGYVDAHTLAFFPAKEPSIKLRILTRQQSLNDAFARAVDLYNRQYENLSTAATTNYHDRFLVVDEQHFYHIGASIKDAGNKSFMFSTITDPDIQALIMNKIKSEWPGVL